MLVLIRYRAKKSKPFQKLILYPLNNIIRIA